MLLAQRVLAEAAGTFTMIFMGGGSVLLAEKHLLPGFWVPITWGAAIALLIFAFGHVSGAHFNPAVTLAFAAAKRLPVSEIFFYWGSQLCGGLMAVGLLEILKK